MGAAPAHPRYRTSCIRHDYFSVSNMAEFPERFVIVGFLAADGCISATVPGQPRVQLNLAQKDRVVLETLNAELAQGGRHIAPGRTTASLQLYFPSQQMCDDLARYGIVPRKTQTFDLPDLPPTEMAYFLRGYFYGDGCFHDYGDRLFYHLVSTTRFAESLKAYFMEHQLVDHVGSYPLKRNPLYSQTVFQGKHAFGFSRFIFNDEKMVLLPRKHVVADRVRPATPNQ